MNFDNALIARNTRLVRRMDDFEGARNFEGPFSTPENQFKLNTTVTQKPPGGHCMQK